jgi:hypothetical protein
VKTGVLGLGFVRTNPSVQWPEDLQVKLPKPSQTKATLGAPRSDGTEAAAPQVPDDKDPDTKTPDTK